MPLDGLWRKLADAFNRVPEKWGFAEGEVTEGGYKHGTSILGVSFSADEKLLALAGGGCIPGADGSIRLVDVVTRKNVVTLHGHVCGVHDVSFDLETGILASASFDYSVFLWNMEEEDVIFLRGEDNKTKGYSRFTREGSLLAVGEYDHYEGPHSFYVYDLRKQRKVFEFALPDEMGVTAMALSPDSAYLAVAARDQSGTKASHLYLVQLGTLEIVQEHSFEGIDFYDLAFAGRHDRILAGVMAGIFGDESGLVEIDANSGAIKWSTRLGGIGVCLACHPTKPEVAVGFEGKEIHFYNFNRWRLTGSHRYRADTERGSVCRVAYSHGGGLFAYGLSTGKFDVISVPE